MELLVCAATLPELKAFGRAEVGDLLADGDRYELVDSNVALVLTGVGIPCALGRLAPVLARLRPRRIINIGIAGAYPDSGLAIGDIVMARSEVYGDVGFELPQDPGFRPVHEAPFGETFYGRAMPLFLDPEFIGEPGAYGFQIARGCTVNTCTGTERTGRLRKNLFEADFETMEGAAVAQVGSSLGIPVCEIRAISNIAAERDMRPENVVQALTNLHDYLQTCLAKQVSL